MRLYLFRHADAVPRGTPGYARDAQRPLTREGHLQARQVAQGLKRLKVAPGLILTSPYVRAVQTAEEARAVFGSRVAVKTLDALRAEANPQETSLALRGVGRHQALILVGHEPHISAWLGGLVAGSGGLRCLFKKAGVACVEVEHAPPPAGSGTLRWLMTPKQLALIGKGS